MSVQPHCAFLPWALAMLALCAGHAARAEALDTAKARARITTQRAEIKSTLAEQERVCRQEFLVAPCVDAARKEQRAVLTRLRNEELALDDAQRKESAARRRQELFDKVVAGDAEAKAGAAALKAARAASRPSDGSAAERAGANEAGRPRGASKAPSKTTRAAQEDSNRAQFAARAQSAQAHREAVEQRNAARAAKGKKANPLPLPAAASAPARSSSTR